LSSQKPETSKGTWLAHRARPLLLLYALLLVVVLFSPSSHVQSSLVVDLGHFLRTFLPDSWVTFTRVEIVMNAVIIAPLTFLGSIVWPRLSWQDWTAYGFLGAAAVELIQGVLLPDRSASLSDIVANGAGAVLGALLRLLLVPAKTHPDGPR
jgi:glycopeptide antibiotics resistance protein